MTIAALGTKYAGVVGSESRLLLAAVANGLKARAGYVPPKTSEPLPKAIDEVGAVVVLAGDTVELDYVTRWCQGRAWLAGSAALWRYEYSRLDIGESMEWNYHDIDLFAMSDEAYKSLYNEFCSMGIDLLRETDNHAVFDGLAVDGVNDDGTDETIYFYEDIGLVRPIKGQYWEHPANLFKTFDLSICQVALGVGWAYLQHPDDVESKTISYGKGRDAVHLLGRIMKYLRRGYTLGDDFLEDVANDEKCADVVYLLAEISELRQYAEPAFENLLSVAQDIVSSQDYEDYELDWDDIEIAGNSDDDDYGDDDWWY